MQDSGALERVFDGKDFELDKNIVSRERVIASYMRSDQRNSRTDVINMIGLYPNWHLEYMDAGECGKLSWIFDGESQGHISHLLTSGGRNREVASVARVYEKVINSDRSLFGEWNYGKIEDMIRAFERGGFEEPVIVVSGEKYPNSPESSFIDGVHRSLAFEVFCMRNPDSRIKLEAFVGKKASLKDRFMKLFRG